jgi:thioredoxin 1
MSSALPGQFEELIRTSTLPVLVDFWAEWCGPCRLVSPAIERIARELKGRIITIKINVDKKQNIAIQYNIASIPTIMLFKNGAIAMRLTGAYPYETIKQEVERNI